MRWHDLDSVIPEAQLNEVFGTSFNQKNLYTLKAKNFEKFKAHIALLKQAAQYFGSGQMDESEVSKWFGTSIDPVTNRQPIAWADHAGARYAWTSTTGNQKTGTVTGISSNGRVQIRIDNGGLTTMPEAQVATFLGL